MRKSNLSELGRTGLPHFGGYVFDEALPELTGTRWRKAIRSMVDNDPVINSVLFSIEMLVRQTSWEVTPGSPANEDGQAADFVRGAIFEDMSSTWPDSLAEILTMLPWGYSYLEVVFKNRRGDSRDPRERSRFSDGRVGWRKWAIRAQEAMLHWEFDDEGGLQGMVQIPPPDYIERFIPIDKALLFRTTTHKGNPEGKSILRSSYRPWYFKSRIENIEGVGIERDLAGLPVIFCPPELLDASATSEERNILAALQTIVTSIKRDEQEGIVFPLAYDDRGNKLYDLELLSTGGTRQFDTDRIISRYDQRILMTVMADFLMLGHGATGSLALAQSKTRMFTTALGAWLDSIAAVINRHAIPRLLRLNGMNTACPPTLTHGPIEQVDLAELGAYIAQLSGAKVTLDEEAQRWLLQQARVPVTDQSAVDGKSKDAANGKAKPADDVGENE